MLANAARRRASRAAARATALKDTHALSRDALRVLINEASDLSMVKRILAEYPKIINDSDEGVTVLYKASYNGNRDVVEFLLSVPGINVNAGPIESMGDDITTPLYIACSRGHTDIVSLLRLHPDIDVNKSPNLKSPLQIAIEKEHIEIMLQLIGDLRTKLDETTIDFLKFISRQKRLEDIFNGAIAARKAEITEAEKVLSKQHGGRRRKTHKRKSHRRRSHRR